MSEDKGNSNHRDDVYSNAVRAGKRTYFFDVKSTRKNDLYLTITESKKRFSDNGDRYYEKHKLFLYKEDFDKFIDGLQDAIDEIRNLREDAEDGNGSADYSQDHQSDRAADRVNEPIASNNYTDVDFDDLDSDRT